jgi:hypothetical protein
LDKERSEKKPIAKHRWQYQIYATSGGTQLICPQTMTIALTEAKTAEQAVPEIEAEARSWLKQKYPMHKFVKVEIVRGNRTSLS